MNILWYEGLNGKKDIHESGRWGIPSHMGAERRS